MPPTQNLAVFTKEYLVNIPEIDEQHEVFFDLLGKIAEIAPDMYKPLDDDEIDDFIDILSELRDYALLHFRTEEAYMQEINYPDLPAQQRAHNRFITDVIRMESEIMNGSSMPPIKICNFIQDWYKDHIIEMDKPFSEFYNKNGK